MKDIKKACVTCANYNFCKNLSKNKESKDWNNFYCKYFEYAKYCEMPYTKINNCPLIRYGCNLGNCKRSK